MSNIRSLVENKSKLDYKELTLSLVQEFGIKDKVEWDSVIPAQVQKELFGGETLRLFKDHETFANQKDIRAIHRSKGETSQLLILSAILNDEKLSKQTIERITKKFVGGQAAERYVVWFLGNPQHSAYKVVLSGKEGKKVVLKTLPFAVDQPYYKTYDFILNEVSSKVNKFFVEPNELWKSLWKAFDISVVNKQFYNDIKSSFNDLVENVLAKSFIKDLGVKKHFTIRLIGRLIFCWFLKKKGIVNDDVLSANAVGKYTNYYKELLEKLFFDVFNTPAKERTKNLPDEIKDYPFLNGGLFEDQKEDFKDNYQLYLPNEWFFNLFDYTLEKYNFTIDENTSSNAEIAIDPEMLGRIFENLLAEQNPETQESARKSTGSYYTPREIVDYMVEQSLIEYLKSNISKDVILNETKWSEESLSQKIEDFVHTEELPEELKPFSKEILDKLGTVKILDPACGSGAFPIGMLQKIIALKLQLSPLTKGGIQGGSKEVYNLKLQTILNSIYGCDIQPMAVELSRLRCWLSLIIDEPVDKKKSNWGIENLPNLDFKFVCVNTLISLPEFSASFGISEDEFNKLKSLREEYFTASAKRKEKIEEEFKIEQKKIAEKHAEWSTKNTEAVTLLINWNPFEVHKTNWFDKFWMFGLIEGFDIIITNPPYLGQKGNKEVFQEIKSAPLGKKYHQRRMDLFYFFFHFSLDNIKQYGIVSFITTNYYLTATYSDKLRKHIKDASVILKLINFNEYKLFESAIGQHNLITILKNDKINQTIVNTAITSRTGLYNESDLHSILMWNDDKTQYFEIDQSEIFEETTNYIRLRQQSTNPFYSNDLSFLKKLEPFDLLSKYCFIEQGIVSGSDRVTESHLHKFTTLKATKGEGIFILSDEELINLNLSSTEKNNYVKKTYKNSTIQKWTFTPTDDLNVLYIKSNGGYFDPGINIRKHLDRFKIILINRNVRAGSVTEEEYDLFTMGKIHISYVMIANSFKSGNYYCLSYARRGKETFEVKKIVNSRRAKSNIFALETKGYYEQSDIVITTLKPQFLSFINLEYILAILNSKLYTQWFLHKGKMKGDIFELFQKPISEVKIKIPPMNVQSNFENIVNQIISLSPSSNKSQIKVFENQIDIMVYKLYDLTYEEVKIIDSEIEEIISKEEYEKFEIK